MCVYRCVCVWYLLTKSLPTSSCSAGRKLSGTCHLRQSLSSTAGTKRLPGLRFRPGMPSRCCHGDAGVRSCSPKEINPFFFSPEASCTTTVGKVEDHFYQHRWLDMSHFPARPPGLSGSSVYPESITLLGQGSRITGLTDSIPNRG